MDFENIANNIWFASFDMDCIGTPEEEKQEEITMLKNALEKLAVLAKQPKEYDFSALLGALDRIFDN